MHKLVSILFIFLIKFSPSFSQSKLLPKILEDEVVGINNLTKNELKAQSLVFSKNFENVIIDTVNNVYIITFKTNEISNNETLAVYDIEKNSLLWEKTYNVKFNDFTFFDEFVLLRTRGKTIKVDIHTGNELWTIENMFLYGSEKLNIGIFYKHKMWSGKNLVEGIDLNSGSVLWTRNDLDMHGSRVIDIVNDSLVTFYEKYSIQNFNIHSGKGWQKKNLNIANYCIHSGNSTSCYNTSRSLKDSTGYIIALSNSIMKIDKNGEEVWQSFFPNELQCSLPYLSIIDNSIFLLNNGGGAMSDFTRYNESNSPFFAKYDLNGNELFFKKFDKKQIIIDHIYAKDTLITLHRKSLQKTETKNGEKVFEYEIKGKEKLEISEFISYFTFVQNTDSSFVKLNPSDSTSYYVYDSDENIRQYSKDLNYKSEKKVGEYWNLSGGFKENLFLKNAGKFVILNKSLKQLAYFDNYIKGIVKQGYLYLIGNNKLSRIDFNQFFLAKK